MTSVAQKLAVFATLFLASESLWGADACAGFPAEKIKTLKTSTNIWDPGKLGAELDRSYSSAESNPAAETWIRCLTESLDSYIDAETDRIVGLIGGDENCNPEETGKDRSLCPNWNEINRAYSDLKGIDDRHQQRIKRTQQQINQADAKTEGNAITDCQGPDCRPPMDGALTPTLCCNLFRRDNPHMTEAQCADLQSGDRSISGAVWDCVKGFIWDGIVKELANMVKSVWNFVFAGEYKQIGVLISEFRKNPNQFMNRIADAIMGSVSGETETFKCLSASEKSKYICEMVGRVASLFIGGAGKGVSFLIGILNKTKSATLAVGKLLRTGGSLIKASKVGKGATLLARSTGRVLSKIVKFTLTSPATRLKNKLGFHHANGLQREINDLKLVPGKSLSVAHAEGAHERVLKLREKVTEQLNRVNKDLQGPNGLTNTRVQVRNRLEKQIKEIDGLKPKLEDEITRAKLLAKDAPRAKLPDKATEKLISNLEKGSQKTVFQGSGILEKEIAAVSDDVGRELRDLAAKTLPQTANQIEEHLYVLDRASAKLERAIRIASSSSTTSKAAVSEASKQLKTLNTYRKNLEGKLPKDRMSLHESAVQAKRPQIVTGFKELQDLRKAESELMKELTKAGATAQPADLIELQAKIAAAEATQLQAMRELNLATSMLRHHATPLPPVSIAQRWSASKVGGIFNHGTSRGIESAKKFVYDTMEYVAQNRSRLMIAVGNRTVQAGLVTKTLSDSQVGLRNQALRALENMNRQLGQIVDQIESLEKSLASSPETVDSVKLQIDALKQQQRELQQNLGKFQSTYEEDAAYLEILAEGAPDAP